MDRSWMLNPKAIRAAKECIQIVKQELGVKLTLSHPEFMGMLYEYVDLTDSPELGKAYSKLLAMAGVGNVVQNIAPRRTVNGQSSVTAISSEVSKDASKVIGANFQRDKYVEFRGKRYEKYRNGKEFKGLYRGQPHYM